MVSATSSSPPSSVDIPPEWARLFDEHLPGYDPVATAAPGEWFDAQAADDAIEFFDRYLVFFEGDKAGQPFALEDWQRAIIGCMFGWKRADGMRRYREAFIYVPRKNGKTPLCAGLVDYVMFCDHESGAQLVSAAADKDQATHVFRHAAHMIETNPELAAMATTYRGYKSIELRADGTVYKALSSDAHTKHGGNLHFIIVDELHAHPNRDLVDVLTTGTGSRSQPLTIYITTADYDRESICNELYGYATKIRDGVFVDDSAFLPVIYEASLDDDWTDPATWKKANPNLDVSVKREYLERECKKAQNQPSYENTFKRLHLNIRTQQDVRWIQLDKWDACTGEVGELAGQECYAGIDLANKYDVAAAVLVFPHNWAWLPFFWVPQDRAREREKSDGVPYLTWARQGYIELTPGNIIDHGFIRKRLNELKQDYDIKEVAFDPWHATQFANQLQDEDGFKMVEFRQGAISMNEPCREFERQIAAKELRHGGNPVLRWMASNVSAHVNSQDLIRPDKQKSNEKIDGIVAGIMGIGRAIFAEKDEPYITPFVG